VRRNNRNTSWWNQGLAVKRRKVSKLFNAAKKSGDWTDYKRTSTDYNKALGQTKRENRGGDTVRRLRRLQNAPYSIGFSLRMSRVLSAPFDLKMEITPQQRKGPRRN
jgi:hypothetical protein